MGMIIKNKTQYSSSSIIVELTQAEYDALSTQEKNSNVFYCITDVNGDEQSFQPVIYSAEEREVGVWTDGKPLYQKTINLTYDNFGSYSSIRYKDLSIGNTSIIDTLVNIHGYVITKTYGAINIPLGYSGWDNATVFGCYTHSTSTDYVLSLMYNANNFSLEDGVIPATVTIQYTKTTDTPGSGTWTPQGVPAVHYSTDEQVVGTWVDGNTIYEKTIDLGADSLVDYNGKDITSLIPSGINLTISCVGQCSTYHSSTSLLIDYTQSIQKWNIYSGVATYVRYITIRYTKSTS